MLRGWGVLPEGPWGHSRDYQKRAVQLLTESDTGGIVVMPPGSGKTRVAVEAALKAGSNRILYVTHGEVACCQAESDVIKSTNVPAKFVNVFTASSRNFPDEGPGILILTYSMLATAPHSERSDTKRMLQRVREGPWDMVVLDEVHMAEARGPKPVLQQAIARAKKRIGLTATLVREDLRTGADEEDEEMEAQEEHFAWIGPVVMRISWRELQDDGWLARMNVLAVSCDQGALFGAAHKEADGHMRRYVAMLPPSKAQAIVALSAMFVAKGDQVAVFADHLYVAKKLAALLARGHGEVPILQGAADLEERNAVLHRLRRGELRVVVATRVVDMSVDLPTVSVVIDADNKGKSQQQCEQRIGRALRPHPSAIKKGETEEEYRLRRLPGQKEAYYVALFTAETSEEEWTAWRTQIIENQGVQTKTELAADIVADAERLEIELPFRAEEEQWSLLKECIETQHRSDVSKQEAQAAIDTRRVHDKKTAERAARIKEMNPIFKKRATKQHAKGRKERREAKERAVAEAVAEVGAASATPPAVLRVLERVRERVEAPGVQIRSSADAIWEG